MLAELAAALRALSAEERAEVFAEVDVAGVSSSPVSFASRGAASEHVQDAPPPTETPPPGFASMFEWQQVELIRAERKRLGLVTPNQPGSDPYDHDLAYQEEVAAWRRERDMRRAAQGLPPFTSEF
jgi:hypothetical protein